MVKIELFPEPESSLIYCNTNNKYKYPLCLSEEPLLELLLKYKQDFDAICVADPVSLDKLIHKNITIKPINFPNRTILGEEFTDDDYEKLCSKLSYQHEQFKRHQLRDVRSKVERTKATFNHLTTEEIFTALKNFDYNEDEVLLYLTKNEFITQIRNQIAQFSHNQSESEDELISDSKKENDKTIVGNDNGIEKELTHVHKMKNNSDFSYNLSSSEDEEIENTEIYKRKYQPNHQSLPNKPVISNKKASRLKLDDALANSADMDGWSEARMKAYQAMKKNPNAYYYRFNAPGETQRNGTWLKEEDELFMKRLEEVGADGQWGIFSIAIPGRVGYQCSNYYRKLIEIGKIKDSNYRLDEKGKAHYVGGKPRVITKLADDDDIEDDETESEDIGSMNSEFESDEKEVKVIHQNNNIPLNNKSTNTNRQNSPHKPTNPNLLFHENPLPGFIDTITKTEIVRPAISPYGHVLSYDTWLKCLLNSDRKNTCPLTNQPLHKRQLIFLTFENIELYRDRIRQIND